jgi:hypothetical protein
MTGLCSANDQAARESFASQTFNSLVQRKRGIDFSQMTLYEHTLSIDARLEFETVETMCYVSDGQAWGSCGSDTGILSISEIRLDKTLDCASDTEFRPYWYWIVGKVSGVRAEDEYNRQKSSRTGR